MVIATLVVRCSLKNVCEVFERLLLRHFKDPSSWYFDSQGIVRMHRINLLLNEAEPGGFVFDDSARVDCRLRLLICTGHEGVDGVNDFAR